MTPTHTENVTTDVTLLDKKAETAAFRPFKIGGTLIAVVVMAALLFASLAPAPPPKAKPLPPPPVANGISAAAMADLNLKTKKSLYAWVPNPGGAEIQIVRAKDGKKVGSVGVGKGPQAVTFTPNGKYALVPCSENGYVIQDPKPGSLYVIRVSDRKRVACLPMGYNPLAAAVSPDGKLAFVSCLYSDWICAIDTATWRIVRIYTDPALQQPRGLAVSPDSSKLFVLNTAPGNISRLAIPNGLVEKTAPAGQCPYGITLSPNGLTAFVSNQYGENISILDTSTLKRRILGVGNAPKNLRLSADGLRLFVENASDKNLYEVDVTGGKVVGKAPSSLYPLAFAALANTP